jgi:hypothetical protein
MHITQTDDTAERLNQYAIREQTQGTQLDEFIDTFSQNTTRNQEAYKHHTRTSQYTDNTKEPTEHDQSSGKHETFTKIRPPEEPNQEVIQNYSTQHKTKIPEHVTVPLPVSGGISAPQAFRGSRHFNCNPTNHKQRAAPRHLTS